MPNGAGERENETRKNIFAQQYKTFELNIAKRKMMERQMNIRRRFKREKNVELFLCAPFALRFVSLILSLCVVQCTRASFVRRRGDREKEKIASAFAVQT